jgi:hypothetical protein
MQDELGKLLHSKSTPETLKQKDFDPRGQYKAVVDAVQAAGSGELGYFRIELDSTRSEYVVVIVDTSHNRLVGLKALSVES